MATTIKVNGVDRTVDVDSDTSLVGAARRAVPIDPIALKQPV
jgi:hypothetical protein